MNLDLIRKRLDEERRTLCRDGEAIEVLPCVTRFRRGKPAQHSIDFSSLTAVNADLAIEDQLAHYRRLHVEFEWKVYSHDQPADLVERLRQRGFSIGQQEAALVLDLDECPEWIDADASHTVVRVDQLEQVRLFCDAAEKIFNKDYGLTGSQLTEAIRANSFQHRGYLAMKQEKVVGIGRLYTHPDSVFGGLYGGGTLASHRGQGFYRAMIAARARDARHHGARYLIVDALPTSRPILTRLGFMYLADTWPCIWQPK